MHALRSALTTLCLALPMHAALAANWEPIEQGKGREDINTWTRHVDGMAVKAFKGEAEVHQTIPVILAVLADIPNLPTWIFMCQSAEQPAGISPDHTYARFKSIWPTSRRDVLMQTSVSQQDDGSVLLESNQSDGLPRYEDFVRIPYMHNTFRLTPLKGGWTRLSFETQVDLGGMVPAWIINMVATKAPILTIEGLRKQMKQAKYQIKSIDELPAYYLKGRPLVIPLDHLKTNVAAN
jgi:START domain